MKTASAPGKFDVTGSRKDFPILSQEVNGKPLVYLDNAATSQKPRQVIDRVSHFYGKENANIHRGVHTLSGEATAAYDQARARVARHLHAFHPEEVIFTRGATEAINLVAQSYLRPRLQAGDEILLTEMEHHANIIPWQLLANEVGAKVVAAPVTDEGEIDLPAFASLLSARTRFASFVHVSNTLGTINPVQELIRLCQTRGVPTLLDGCQSVPHWDVDVQALGCDFFVFSGHKVLSPTGIGALWGRKETLNAMPPYQGGGDMIELVSFEKTTFRKVPERFEAGTPHIAGAIGLDAGFAYLEGLDRKAATAHESDLLENAREQLEALGGIRLLGHAPERAGAVSFLVEGAHPHDVGTILDTEGIAIRVGHHCTQPLMRRFKIVGTARASFAFYNTHQEVDALVAGVQKVQRYFN
ncbi:MAG: cysteine desulfurase [Verrucomicrobiota bacterium]